MGIATASGGRSLPLFTTQKQVTLALKRVKAQEDGIPDAYANEATELDRYRAEVRKLRVRRHEKRERPRRSISTGSDDVQLRTRHPEPVEG